DREQPGLVQGPARRQGGGHPPPAGCRLPEPRLLSRLPEPRTGDGVRWPAPRGAALLRKVRGKVPPRRGGAPSPGAPPPRARRRGRGPEGLPRLRREGGGRTLRALRARGRLAGRGLTAVPWRRSSETARSSSGSWTTARAIASSPCSRGSTARSAPSRGEGAPPG